MSTFDPFTATLDEAMASTDPLAIARWGTAQQLLARREHFEQHPLDGVAICVIHDLVAPAWLARAFLACYRKVTNAHVASWDEAFGRPYPKGINLARARQRRLKRQALFVGVLESIQRNPSQPLDEVIERVGKEHGAGRTLADELYREAVQMHGFGASKLKRTALSGTRSRNLTSRQPASSENLAGGKRKR